MSTKLDVIQERIPLFLSPQYILINIPKPKRFIDIKITRTYKGNSCVGLLDQESFRIIPNDLADLRRIEPFRDWESEANFRVGNIWKYTFHEFRRSLAFYAVQSALVTLPSLKKQLNHVTKRMTYYYGQANGVINNNVRFKHFSEFMNSLRDEATMICLFDNLVNSDEKLYGPAAKQISTISEPSPDVILETRQSILKKVNDGSFSFSDTPVGVCLTTTPCQKRTLGSIAACISCPDAVIKKSMLDVTIKRGEQFVAGCKRNKQDDFQFRYESAELKILKNYRSLIAETDS